MEYTGSRKINKFRILVCFALLMALTISVKGNVYGHTLSSPKSSTGYAYEPETWNYIYFGSYPQTEVKNTTTIKAIESKLRLLNKTEGDVRVGNYRYRKVSRIRKHYIKDNESAFKYVKENHYYKWEKIKWRVLKVENDKAYIMADKALMPIAIHSGKENAVTWASSSLRKELNSNFYMTAFSQNERKAVLSSYVDNATYSPEGGREMKQVAKQGNTTDKIFIPSVKDLLNSKYGFGEGYGYGLKAHMNRTVTMTDYIGIDEEAYISSADKTAKYWLRTNTEENSGFFYCWNGRFQYNKLNQNHLCLTPALWIDLNKERTYVKTTFNNKHDGKNLDGNDTFNISYALRKGQNSAKNPSIYYSEDGVSKLYSPTRDGYDFLGWYKEKGCINRITSIARGSSSNITVYAKWEKHYDPDAIRYKYVTSGNVKYRIMIQGKDTIKDVMAFKLIKAKKKQAIADTVTYNGKVLPVTSIKAGLLENNKTMITLVIGKNIETIGSKAFYNCKNLKSIEILSTKLESVNVKAHSFEKINSRAVVKVPKKKYEEYRKWLKKRGISGNKQKITY